MSKDEMSSKIRKMVRFIIKQIMPEDSPSTEGNNTPTPPDPTQDYFSSPERQETYRRIREWTSTKELISDTMLEEELELSYCTTLHAIRKMQEEGIISRERNADYRYRVL